MPVKIENMDMPKSCTDCRYCDSGSAIGRLYCRLTRHDFQILMGVSADLRLAH